MKKIILTTTIISLLSSCYTTIPKDEFRLNIKSSSNANNGNNYLLVYEQPSSMDKMAQATYNSLSREILDNDHQSKLVHPQDQSTALTFKAKDEPAAIYFVVNMGKNYNTWRYYIPNPGGNSWDCSINGNGNTSCQQSGK
ncbi:type VI secretion system lipoprotein IglE [Francisella sp. SYW-9]|uniref:type VI secretion system lipoprotein IglE n=1 Tax=Francisella sp. SYW-9 TaxID=2610888 RepID=UPI00123DA75D|nr:type VI secretion system lipoprotein IglE [Francisella sp. SYW-9]